MSITRDKFSTHQRYVTREKACTSVHMAIKIALTISVKDFLLAASAMFQLIANLTTIVTHLARPV
jgi:hypothetical protein